MVNINFSYMDWNWNIVKPVDQSDSYSPDFFPSDLDLSYLSDTDSSHFMVNSADLSLEQALDNLIPDEMTLLTTKFSREVTSPTESFSSVEDLEQFLFSPSIDSPPALSETLSKKRKSEDISTQSQPQTFLNVVPKFPFYSHQRAKTDDSLYNETMMKMNKVLAPISAEMAKLKIMYEKVCDDFTRGSYPDKPEGMQRELMPYQWFGYKWMEMFQQGGIGCCLGDDMGLGKTIQSIALIQSIVNQKKQSGESAHILICCPSNLIKNWQTEFQLNCPDLVTQLKVIEGKDQPVSTGIYLISHQKLRLLRSKKQEDSVFPFNKNWDVVIVDEFHSFISSKKSEQTIQLLREKVQGPQHGFIALTGTPMPNHLVELYQLNALLNPNIYPKISSFKQKFVIPAKVALKQVLKDIKFHNGHLPFGYSCNNLETYVVELIEMLTKNFILRRLKRNPEFKAQTDTMQRLGKSSVQSLPVLEKEMRISYPFNELQKTIIQAIVGDDAEMQQQTAEIGALSLFNESKKNDESLFLRDYLCLQQVSDHPAVLASSEKLTAYLNGKDADAVKELKTFKVNYAEEGKLKSITHLVRSILDQNPKDKILIFTNFEKMGQLVCEGLKQSALTSTIEKIKSVQFLSGALKKELRQPMINQFKGQNGPPILVAGRKLGSTGWNCTEANHLVLVDPWWNPNDDDQCIGRLFRIGQTKPVHVYRMHQEGFVVDDKMDNLRVEKKAWCELILSGDTTHIQEKILNIMGKSY